MAHVTHGLWVMVYGSLAVAIVEVETCAGESSNSQATTSSSKARCTSLCETGPCRKKSEWTNKWQGGLSQNRPWENRIQVKKRSALQRKTEMPKNSEGRKQASKETGLEGKANGGQLGWMMDHR